MIHVGVISPEFPPEIGGIQTYAYEFVKELVRQSYRVTVFTIPHAEGEISMPGVRIVPALKLRRALDRSLLEGEAIDVWHVMNAAYAWVTLEATARVVVSVHGNDFLQPYFPIEQPTLERWPGLWRSRHWRPAIEVALGRKWTQRLVARGLRKAAHILANSRYTERVLLEKYPQCKGRTSAAMVGVSADFLMPGRDRSRADHVRLITVCRLAEQRKNVDLVMRALATLKDRYDFTYVVVGTGPLQPSLEQLAEDVGLRQRVRFAGQMAGNELRRQLSESDLFILTSSIHPASHEGFGIAYLEANACGTPVLAARLAGAAEAVAEGTSGFFVDEPTVDSIAEALALFLGRSITFDSQACRAFASQFTWDKVVRRALDFYPSAGYDGTAGGDAYKQV